MKKSYISFSFIFLCSLIFGACDGEFSSSADVGFIAPNNSTGATGQGGSMARFAITNDVLYTVGYSNLTAFDISNAQNPSKITDIQIGTNIETIFPYQGKLYIGSQDGMYIYGIANPLTPNYLGHYWHITSCDPVVVQGDYAYVTLRNGSDCRFGENILDVINIRNPSFPELLHTQTMLNPHGLAVQGNRLFVCEGKHGLKVFDISNPAVPNLIEFIQEIEAYDLIALNNLLIISGFDGIYQYHYSEGELNLLSKIE